MKKISNAYPDSPISNPFILLTQELLFIILDHLGDDPLDRKSFSQACKAFYTTESHHRRALKPLRPDFLQNLTKRFPYISHIDFSFCPRVDDHTLTAVSESSWGCSLCSVNLSRSSFFTHKGLSDLVFKCWGLVEIDISNRTDLSDSAAQAIGGARNLERLWMGRCKSISDLGIACIADGCRNLRLICLRWCLCVSDCGVGFLATKCKKLKSLDLSYLLITEKCLPPIYRLEHLEELILEQCLGIDDKGLSTLKVSSMSLKVLNLSKCQNITHVGLSSLLKGAKRIEQLILSNSFAVTSDLVKCLHSFSRLELVKLDGCLGTNSGIKAIRDWHSSLVELSISKCPAVTDECLCFVVQTHNGLRKLDITCCRKITYASIDSITNSCSKLTSLRMESCGLVSGKAFELMGKRCPCLEELDATDNHIDDKGLESISRCPKISSLKLGICLNITDNGIAHIASSCSRLKELDLYRCLGVTDLGIAAIACGCPALEMINFAYNTNVTDDALISLSKCLKLIALEFRGCPRVSSAGLTAIASTCRRLTVLDIKKCYDITDSGMLMLAQHSKNIKQINLSYCSVTDVGLLALARISSLQTISVFHVAGLTPNGIAASFLTGGNLRKVKLNKHFKSLVPQPVIDRVEANGCLLHWRDKAFRLSRSSLSSK